MDVAPEESAANGPVDGPVELLREQPQGDQFDERCRDGARGLLVATVTSVKVTASTAGS
jgi:hypothetical protein